MKPIKAIIWDLDGTLINFKINSIKARHECIKILNMYGVPKEKLSITYPITENVAISKNHFHELDLPLKKVKKILKEVNEVVINIEKEAAVKATLTNGVDHVLEFAQRQRLKQAIFTYNTHKNSLLSVQTAKISHFIDLIVGRDDVKNLKPHPDHLKYICDKLRVGFDEIVVIGDSSRDIEAALNVGCYSIALDTKNPTSIERDFFIKADKIVKPEEIPHELIKMLKELL